jgi:hypothetical protein
MGWELLIMNLLAAPGAESSGKNEVISLAKNSASTSRVIS